MPSPLATPLGMAAALTAAEIADGEAYHRALYHRGDVDSPTSWHRDSVSPLLDLAMPHIKDGAVVVDYGSGTGGSAIELLKRTDAAGIAIELILMDPLLSWFYKAEQILGHREGVSFELSLGESADGRMRFRTMQEMLRGRKADVIISSSTLHLIPQKAFPDLTRQFADSLSAEGVLIWDSGDVESSMRPADSALLHDPFRMVREHIRDHPLRLERLSDMEDQESRSNELRADRIFPYPHDIEVLLDSFSAAGFSSEISDRVVDFRLDDAERFILVPRLSAIAAPLVQGEERDAAVSDAIEHVIEKMRQQGTAGEESYRSHWVYGYHRLT